MAARQEVRLKEAEAADQKIRLTETRSLDQPRVLSHSSQTSLEQISTDPT